MKEASTFSASLKKVKKMKIDFNEAVALLKEKDKILILTHANPDGDTIGSGFALLRALRQLGKRVKLRNSDIIPSKYNYLFEDLEDDDFEEEFIVSVDVAEKKLLGDKLLPLYGERVNLSLDHHSTSRLFAEKTYCESESASACEVIYLVIKALGAEITKEIANCIFTGMSTDTGCFKYSSVTERTHILAAELISFGAEHFKINERMFDTKTQGSLALYKMCLENLDYFAGGKIASICVTKDMLEKSGTTKSDLDAIKPLTRQIEGVKIGLTVKEEENGKIGVSVRTDEDVDASAICANFGGGGHVRAAGCEFRDVSVKEAQQTVVDYILKSIL